MAVFADPVLNVNDARVANARVRIQAAPAAFANADLIRSANESGIMSFERLRFSDLWLLGQRR